MNYRSKMCIVLILIVSYGDLLLGKKLDSITTFLNTSQHNDGRQIYEYGHHVKWLCFNTSEEYDCCQIKEVHCFESGPALPFGYCATYSESNSLSIAKCPYYEWSKYNVTTPGYISLPVLLTELNNYMCGPLNRKGLVCSECAKNFGPSVNSYGPTYKCANCTNAWYHILLVVFAQFVPTTLLFFIILMFKIRVISPPMPCFIMYAQIVVLGFDLYIAYNDQPELIFTKDGEVRLDMKIILSVYGLFSLIDIFQYVFPPLCLSSQLKQIHVIFLGYISVFYPIFLIFLTWVCVSLHDYNFRPLVRLWRPFHNCFVRLRRGWNIKSDLVDAFITFYLLSYTKSSYQAFTLLTPGVIVTTDSSGNLHNSYPLLIDNSIDYFGCSHLPFAVPALCLLFVFNILPALVLLLYPFRVFRSCLSKCRLNFITVYIFADKIQSCYRNGLDGGKDMRSMSGLYFFCMIGLFIFAAKLLYFAVGGDNIYISDTIASLYS